MTDFEKAVRYLCFEKADNDVSMICRYVDIEKMIYGDKELIKRYSKKYEKLLDLLCN